MKDFIIDGFVTSSVERRTTQGGRMVTRFGINSPDFNRETNERKAQFFDCEYWSDPASDKAANIQEGALLMLWGKLAQDKWQDQQTGQNRSKVVLKVQEVAVIRAGQPRAQQAPAPQQGYQQPAYRQPAYAPQPGQYAAAPAPAPAPRPAAQPPAQPPLDVYDADIPF